MLTVRIDKELEVAIERLARAEGSTKSSIVCDALVRYIEDCDDAMMVAQARRAGGRTKSIAGMRKLMGLN